MTVVKKRAYLAEDKARRRQEILDAAEALITDGALPSLAAIAHKANIVKGTVYLYFNSKEEIYLGIMNDGLRELVAEVLTELSESKNIQAVIDAFCGYCAGHLKFVYLASISPVILENNIQPETAKVFKQALSEGIATVGEAIASVTGQSRPLAEKRFFYAYLMMISIYQQAYPPKVIADAIDECRLDNLKMNFQSDLKQALNSLWEVQSA